MQTFRFPIAIAGAVLLSSTVVNALEFTTSPTIEQNPNPQVPLVAVLYFETDEAVTTTVRVSDFDGDRILEFGASDNPAAGLPILGLKPGRRHRIDTVIENASGDTLKAESLHYVTPELPSGMGNFPPITVLVSEPEKMEPGITFLSVRRRVPGRSHWITPKQRKYQTTWGVIVAVDAKGEVVWYYESDTRIAGIDRLSNGNLLFHLTDFRTKEVDLLGNTVTEWYAADRPTGPPNNSSAIPIKGAQTLHHQPLETPMGTFMSFSANARQIENYYSSEFDEHAPRKTAMVMGDDIIEFDRDGNELWRWSTWDHLDPFRIGYEMTEAYWFVRGFPDHLDWTHGNGLEYDPRDDSVIINLRIQDALIKIDRKSGEIVWILGEPTGWSEKLQKKLLKPVGQPFEWHYHAHNPRLTESGTIVLFDNGKYRARPFLEFLAPEDTYSRTVEYEVDEKKMTVRQVWASYDSVTDDNCNSYAMGDAHWLPETGNIFVVNSICDYRVKGQTHDEFDYSARHPGDLAQWSRIREYSGPDNKEVVFEIEIRDPHDILQWQTFGGFRTPDLYR